LVRDIVAEHEFFNRYDFGENKQGILCGVNRGIWRGKNAVGLLLLEPSGFLKTILIDRDTLTVVHQKTSLLRKELRQELALNGIKVSDAKLLARQVMGHKEKREKQVAIDIEESVVTKR
jgi:hypothetical protein